SPDGCEPRRWPTGVSANAPTSTSSPGRRPRKPPKTGALASSSN
ncbi:uncharacterized protein METZ01_LOCUS402100, partial [marine metagenome]